jgi:spoIIIJ-associated protein
VEWVEASGKSLPEAKEIVLDLLGVAEDDAEFVILSEPKAGLFGRLRGEARVQARVRPVAPPPKRGRRQRPDRNRGGGDRSRGGSGRERSDNTAGDNGHRTDGAVSVDAGSGGPAENGSAAAGRSSGQPADRSSSRSGSRRKRGPRGGAGNAAGDPGSNGGAPKQQSKQGSGRSTGDREDSMEESLTLEQQGEAATEFVAGLVREFGLDADVNFVELDEETVQVAADGDDLGLLVGPRGATLAAVQDLTRTFVQRQSEVRTDRILVDVGGYREKRSAALRRFTEGIVEEVRSSGEERALEPMSPADRKVVHDTVNEIEGVETRSDGTEPSRYVVIQPSS